MFGNETIRVPAYIVAILGVVVAIGGAVTNVLSNGEATVGAIMVAVFGALAAELARSQTNSPSTEHKQQVEAAAWGGAVAQRELLSQLAPDVAGPELDFDPFLDPDDDTYLEPTLEPFFDTAEGVVDDG